MLGVASGQALSAGSFCGNKRLEEEWLEPTEDPGSATREQPAKMSRGWSPMSLTGGTRMAMSLCRARCSLEHQAACPHQLPAQPTLLPM